MIPLNDRSEIPQLKLPLDVTIVRHPKEKKSKSSVIPVKVLAPDNVEILHIIEVPEQVTEKYVASDASDQEKYDSVVLMFPSDDAIEVSEMTP